MKLVPITIDLMKNNDPSTKNIAIDRYHNWLKAERENDKRELKNLKRRIYTFHHPPKDPWTKEKQRAYKRKYYHANREKLLKRMKEYHIKNREKLLARMREYYKRKKNET